MPNTRRYKGKKKRRNGRRRRNYPVVRKSPVPLKFYTKLRYVDQVQLDPGAGSADSIVIHGNSCYDPIVVAGGHQPRGFDEIMALYDHFVVIGSKITVSFQPLSSTTTNLYGGIVCRDAGTALSVFNDYMEGGNVKSGPISTQGARATVMSYAASPRKFLGRSRVLADPELKGSASSNPTEGYYYHIFAAATDGASNPGIINVVLTIDYSVVFIEPKVPTQS